MSDANGPRLPETTLALIDAFSQRPIVHKGERVVTFGMVDRLHGTGRTARASFDQNKERFVEGRDFFRVPYAEWSQWVGAGESEPPTAGFRGEEIALTESGYLLLIKPVMDGLSWASSKVFLDAYFPHEAPEAGDLPDDFEAKMNYLIALGRAGLRGARRAT